MTDLDYRDAAKRWRRRNSDMHDTWEHTRSANPPARTIEESALPQDAALRLAEDAADPLDVSRGVSERHLHTWGVDEPS